jgi:selenocysteine-specific elongation factor
VNKHLVAGTAGHIDHGKTTLIRSLTGVNTDRLKEEQERGITIELGFASLKLPNGTILGLVDVPGHEKFVRHMVAGAAGIDLVILVVAADEGIMPQTREHLDICRMLGIGRGLVALTKKDLVDAEWLELITGEVRSFTRGTFLENEPVIAVSSATGEGLSELLAALERLVAEINPRPAWGIFRMPVDRVFTMKGFGTVVTGTTTSGKLHTGDTIRVYPGDLETKVRGLQVHNESVEEAEAGLRTAINLQGVEKSSVARGDVVGHAGQLSPSFIMDVRLTVLPATPHPLANRARVRFHLGSKEILGRVHLLEGAELSPGGQGLAQIRLEEPTVALARDRFVIRSYSPSMTIGGGMIIDPAAAKFTRRKKAAASLVATLRSLEAGTPDEALLATLLAAGPAGGTSAGLVKSLNLDGALVESSLTALSDQGAVFRVGTAPQDPILHLQVLRELEDRITALVEAFHRDNPLKAGLPREELKTKLPKGISVRLLQAVVERAVLDGLVSATGKVIRSASFRVNLSPRQEALRAKIITSLEASGLSAPSPAELASRTGAGPAEITGLLGLLADEGELVRVHEDIYVRAVDLTSLEDRILEHFTRSPEMTVGDFKDLSGLSRKYTIPILEHFDRTGVTFRAGEKRVPGRR